MPKATRRESAAPAPAESIRERVRRVAVQVLSDQPNGLHFVELRDRLIAELSDVAPGNIPAGLVEFSQNLPTEVLKPSRGLYLHSRFAATAARAAPAATPASRHRHPEAAFYSPFAEWLVNELEECTRAIALGGNVFRGKWGTPDVIGVREQPRGSLISFPAEIVSAEIKVDGHQLIVAFGQAVAYRLFSHKSYLVIPVSSPEEDVARLDVLARVLGIGLILFDTRSPAQPNFSIRVRAMKHEPDGFYLNDCLRHVQQKLFR
jgi:hypothetical protein